MTVFLAIFPAVFQLGIPRASAGQEECSTVRMDYKGGSMEHVHVREQLGLGICFAEAGAQLADAIRFSRLGETDYGFQTSGVAVAGGLSVERKRNAFRKGGQACWALSYIQSHGVCAEAAVESNPRIDRSFETGSEALSSQILREISQVPPEATSRPTGRVSLACFRRAEDAGPLPDRNWLGDALEKRLVSASCDVRDIRRLTSACTSRSKPPTLKNPFSGEPPLGCDVFPGSPEENTPGAIGGAIDRELDAPAPLPVEIHFCPKVLNPRQQVDCGRDGHAALVIGRRWNPETRSCQYLLRNSWGTECRQYPPEVGGHGNCEEGLGNIWLDRKKLLANTEEIVRPPRSPPPTAAALTAWEKARSRGFPPAIPPSRGAGRSPVRFQVRGRVVAFNRLGSWDGIVSADCRIRGARCAALVALGKGTTSGLENQRVGGADPGALICSALKGTNVIGVDLRTGNEDGLCLFAGGSYVSTATLYLHALENDGLLVPSKN